MSQHSITLPNGNILVTEVRRIEVGSQHPDRAFFSLYTPDGTALVQDRPLDFPDPTGASTDQVVIDLVAPMPDGSLRFYFYQRGINDSSRDYYYRDFSATGTPLGDPVPNTLMGSSMAETVPLADGRVVLMLSDAVAVIDVPQFNANRTGFVQIPITLPAQSDIRPDPQTIEELSDGRLFVLANIPDASRATTDLSVVGYFANATTGAVLGGPITVLDGGFRQSLSSSIDRNSLAVTELTDGRILVAASRRDEGGTDTREAVFATVLNADGTVAIAPFLASGDYPSTEMNLRAFAMPDGGFALSYITGSVNGPTYTGLAVAQLFSATGEEIATLDSQNNGLSQVGVRPFFIQSDGDVLRLSTTAFDVAGRLEIPTGLRPADDEFRISSDALGALVRDPDAVMTPDGDILFVTTGLLVNGTFGVTVHRTEAAGGAPTQIFGLNAGDLGFTALNRLVSGADIAVRADGSFAVAMVAYESFVQNGVTRTEYALFIQHFSAAGAALGAPVELERWPAGGLEAPILNPRLEAIGDGYLLSNSTRGGDRVLIDKTDIYKIVAGGGHQGSVLELPGNRPPEMLALSNGQMLLAWIEGGLRTAVVNANGTLSGAVANLDSMALTGGFTHNQTNAVALRQLSDGRIFALFEGRADGADPAGLYLLQLDATGQAIGSRKLVVPQGLDGGGTLTPSASNQKTRFDLAEFADGQLVVAFTFDPPGSDERDVGLITLSPSGDPLGTAPIVLTENTDREQSQPSFLVKPNGTLVLTFYDERPAAIGGRNEMRAVELIGPVLDLPGAGDETPGDDVLYGTAGADTLEGLGGNDVLWGLAGNDRLDGGAGDDTAHGGDGTDTLIGGEGDDFLYGGATEADLRDVMFGGAGNDRLEAGWGNDELNGGAGDDWLDGGFGSDTMIGNEDNDMLIGGAGSDLMFGGPGNDTLNGGWGFDRMNGGAGADRFFHVGVADHGSDWVQDYSSAEGDVLVFGLAGATRAQFQINRANTPSAGSADVDEAFVIYRPTGQIMWALVDGMAQGQINVQIGGQVFDLLA